MADFLQGLIGSLSGFPAGLGTGAQKIIKEGELEPVPIDDIEVPGIGNADRPDQLGRVSPHKTIQDYLDTLRSGPAVRQPGIGDFAPGTVFGGPIDATRIDPQFFLPPKSITEAQVPTSPQFILDIFFDFIRLVKDGLTPKEAGDQAGLPPGGAIGDPNAIPILEDAFGVKISGTDRNDIVVEQAIEQVPEIEAVQGPTAPIGDREQPGTNVDTGRVAGSREDIRGPFDPKNIWPKNITLKTVLESIGVVVPTSGFDPATLKKFGQILLGSAVQFIRDRLQKDFLDKQLEALLAQQLIFFQNYLFRINTLPSYMMTAAELQKIHDQVADFLPSTVVPLTPPMRTCSVGPCESSEPKTCGCRTKEACRCHSAKAA